MKTKTKKISAERSVAILSIFGLSEMTSREVDEVVSWLEAQALSLRGANNKDYSKQFRARLLK